MIYKQFEECSNQPQIHLNNYIYNKILNKFYTTTTKSSKLELLTRSRNRELFFLWWVQCLARSLPVNVILCVLFKIIVGVIWCDLKIVHFWTLYQAVQLYWIMIYIKTHKKVYTVCGCKRNVRKSSIYSSIY